MGVLLSGKSGIEGGDDELALILFAGMIRINRDDKGNKDWKALKDAFV